MFIHFSQVRRQRDLDTCVSPLPTVPTGWAAQWHMIFRRDKAVRRVSP